MKRYCRLIFHIVFPIITLLLVVQLLPRLLMFFLPFVLGWIIAALANPFIRFLNQKTHIMRRQHASAFIIVLLLLMIAGLLYLCISRAVQFGISSAKRLPELYAWAHTSVLRFIAEYESLFERLPESISSVVAGLYENFDQLMSSFVSSLASPTVSVSVGAVRSLPTILVYLVVSIFSAYCFATEHDRIVQGISVYIPQSVKKYTEMLKQDIKKILRGWLLAQFKIMFVVFAVLLVGFWILKIRYAVAIAFVTAFLDFLPMFGVGFVLWPWVVIELISGHYMMALWLGVIYLATQVVRQLMQPKIMGDTMGLPPLLTILFLYLGFKFYGLTGMIFSMPVGMLFLSFYRYGAFDRMLHSLRELYEELAGLLR